MNVLTRIKVFEVRRVILGGSKSIARCSKRRERRFGRRQEPKKQRRENQEAPQEPHTHDLSSSSTFQSLHQAPEVGRNRRGPTATSGNARKTTIVCESWSPWGGRGVGTVIVLTASRPLTSRGRRTTSAIPSALFFTRTSYVLCQRIRFLVHSAFALQRSNALLQRFDSGLDRSCLFYNLISNQ